VGKEAHVEATFADGGDAGRLQYEPPKLIFRGRARRVFEAAALAGVRAEADELVLADGSRFRLGDKAARGWADAILNPKGRLTKLGVKPGLTVGISNLRDAAFAAGLAAEGHAQAPTAASTCCSTVRTALKSWRLSARSCRASPTEARSGSCRSRANSRASRTPM